MMRSQVFVHKDNGEMATQIPILEIAKYRKADREETNEYYERKYRVTIEGGTNLDGWDYGDAIKIAKDYHIKENVRTYVVDAVKNVVVKEFVHW